MLRFVNQEQYSEKLVLSALLTLANIAVLPDWHDEFYPILHQLNSLIDSGSPQIKLQVLKLLVNLSCNEDMVPSLLAAQVRYYEHGQYRWLLIKTCIKARPVQNLLETKTLINWN